MNDPGGELGDMLRRAETQFPPDRPEELIPPEPKLERGMFVDAMTPALAGLGNLVCDRLKVTHLENPEAAAIAGALYQLGDAYGLLGQLDPRTAAWLGLGMVAAGIAANRRKVVDAEPPNDTAAAT